MSHANTVLGVGNDIIEVDRIREGIATHGARFLSRLFTLKEQEYCLNHQDSAPRFAGRFAAKEAIVKALGVGFGEEISWLDIEILSNDAGMPIVHLSKGANEKFRHPKILLSISHCKLFATAIALRL
jgi:holo-[acyl-carrier protein] synthase